MTSHAPALIGGPSLLARDPAEARAQFEDAHAVLSIAESEIKRLSAIIDAIPDTDQETQRLLRLVAEHVMHQGTHTLTDTQVDDLRLWYFRVRRTR